MIVFVYVERFEVEELLEDVVQYLCKLWNLECWLFEPSRGCGQAAVGTLTRWRV
jgi:hypothetical protein